MVNKNSLMRMEIKETPAVVQRQLEQYPTIFAQWPRSLSEAKFYSLLTVARGSSDHAAQYLNYVTALKLGKLSTSFTPSLLTLYKKKIMAQQSLAVAISQSGKSPDVILPMKHFQKNAQSTLAIVNDETSPLARQVEGFLPLLAGPELSVAATKSFMASCSASAFLISLWAKDKKISRALQKLPNDIELAQKVAWQKAIPSLLKTEKLLVIGRGISLPMAFEAALKLKETCGIQAEAFSSAEVQHGPQAIIEKGYPVLIFANRGPTLSHLIDCAKKLRQRKAKVLLVAPKNVPTRDFDFPVAHEEILDPICGMASFYLLVEELSRAKGFNPDRPPHLQKVTKTY